MNLLLNLIEEWLRYLKSAKNLSTNTVEAYRSDIKQLVSFFQEYSGEPVSVDYICSLARSDIRAWFLFRKNANETAKTISRGLSALKSFIRFLIHDKKIENSIVLSIRPPKVEKSLPRPLNISQINNIIDTIGDVKQTDWIVKRDRALLVLIYSVGLRISEALNLDRDDISYSTDSLTILGKGGKSRVVPLLDPVKTVIFEYMNSHKFDDSVALFVNNRGDRLTASSVQKLLKKSRELLGLSSKVTPHALRHSCATHLMENTGDLRGIQELLGHSSISSTQIYADVAQKYIAEIYDKCHPLSDKNFSVKKE